MQGPGFWVDECAPAAAWRVAGEACQEFPESSARPSPSLGPLLWGQLPSALPGGLATSHLATGMVKLAMPGPRLTLGFAKKKKKELPYKNSEFRILLLIN